MQRIRSSGLRHAFMIGVPSLILMISSATLLVDLAAEQQDAKGKVLGEVIRSEGDAKRRASDRFRWFQLRNRGPVFSEDSVRTSEGGHLSLKFKDGSELELGENTLVVLRPAGDQIELKFDRGSVKFKGGDSGFVLKTKGPKVSARKASGVISAAGDDSLSIEAEQGDLNLTDDRGQVKTGAKKVELSSAGFAKLVDLDAVLLGPKNFETLVQANPPNPAVVTLSWRFGSAVHQIEDLKILVSSSAYLDHPLFSRGVTSESQGAVMAPLVSGKYHWGITGRYQGRLLRSAVQSFQVIEATPLELVQPADRSLVRLTAQVPEAEFKWKGSPFYKSYRVEFSTFPNFSKIDRVVDSTTDSVRVRLNTAKELYWRVRGFGQVGEKTWLSRTGMIRAWGLDTPSIGIRDVVPRTISNLRIGKEQDFRWKTDVFEEFSKVTIWNAETNIVVFSERVPLKNGLGGIRFKPREPAKLNWEIKVGTNVERGVLHVAGAVPAVVLSEPTIGGKSLSAIAKGDAPASGVDLIHFSWGFPGVNFDDKNLKPTVNRLQFSADEGFSRVIEEVKTDVFSAGVISPDLLLKPLYYRVIAVFPDGEQAVSPIERFTFPFAAPVATSPIGGESISKSLFEKTQNNRLVISWNPTPFAVAYEVEFFPDHQSSKPLFKQVSSKNFLVVKTPAPGVYWWRVTSIGATKPVTNGRTPAASRAIGFRSAPSKPEKFVVDP